MRRMNSMPASMLLIDTHPEFPRSVEVTGLLILLAIELGLWLITFEMKAIVAVHLRNLSKGGTDASEETTSEPIFDRRSSGDRLWFWGMFILAWVATFGSIAMHNPADWLDYLRGAVGGFIFFTLLFMFIEYLRLMVSRTGILYALYDVVAWLAVIFIGGVIIWLIVSGVRRLF